MRRPTKQERDHLYDLPNRNWEAMPPPTLAAAVADAAKASGGGGARSRQSRSGS